MADFVYFAGGGALFALMMAYALWAQPGLRRAMLEMIVAGAVALGVAVYLLVVLLRPEKF